MDISKEELKDIIKECLYQDQYLLEANNSGSSLVEKIYSSLFGSIKLDLETKEFIIKNINFNKFYIRLKEMYNHRGIKNLFENHYSQWDMWLWRKERKNKADMKIVNLSVPLFFALELYRIFLDLAEHYDLGFYKNIAKSLYEKTWISNHEKKKEIPTDTTNLRNIKFTLKDYQEEFIRQYNILKTKFDLNGYILTFEQGLGKTLTAIGLAECLDKDQIIIVCPNSLRENWAFEIKSYFDKYSNEELWINDIYCKGTSRLCKTRNPKYIIVNQESIDTIFNIVKNNKNTMIIVDECHNFRNIASNRTAKLIELKEKSKCTDSIMMSGTPIKAIPAEIIPCLRMIDPYFTENMAIIYKKAFNAHSDEIVRVVKERFSRVIYRKTKAQVLKLPEKNIIEQLYKIKNPERYYISYIRNQVRDEFDKIYTEKLRSLPKLVKDFATIVNKYSSAPKKLTREYLEYINNLVDPDKYTKELYEHRQEVYNTFLEVYVFPNIDNKAEYKYLEELSRKYVGMKQSAMGQAIGKILPPARSNCYIELFDQNKNIFIKYINDNTKKTIIFTQFLPVAKHIYEELNKNNIGSVLIVGETKDRMAAIQAFKQTDDIDVLVATTQTLSTGVTLTEANQMFFFGTPYRSADFNQACDRIHRIGQTTDVNIYITLLDSPQKNITNRLQDILTWSDNASNSVMDLENLIQ